MQAEASFLVRIKTPTTYAVLARVSPGYPPLPGRLPTCYSPVRRSPAAEAAFAHDLHVLSTPPAFILSQDQTLQFRSFNQPARLTHRSALVRNFLIRTQSQLQGITPRRHDPARSLALFPLFSFQRTDASPSRLSEAGGPHRAPSTREGGV